MTESAHEKFCSYHQTGSQAELKNWVDDLASIIEAQRFSEAASDFRAGIFYRYGIGLQWLGVYSGETALFNAAKRAWAEAASLTPARSSLNIRSRYNIAISAVNDHRFSGVIRILDEAIASLNECINDAGPCSPEVALCWEGTSLAFERRFVSAGKGEDLDKAVRAAQRCVEISGPESPRNIRYMCRLATALRAKYRSSGNLDDLDRTIAIYGDLDRAVPRNSAEWPIFMGDAASAWRMRHEQTGRHEDLEVAAGIDERRLRYTPSESLNYEIALNSHGVTMLRLFAITRDRSHLDQSIKSARASVAILREDHTHFPTNSNNLGNALLTRYKYYGNKSDLNESIRSYERAVARAFPSVQMYAMYLYNLGAALMEKYDLTPKSDLAKTVDRLLEKSCAEGLGRAAGVVLQGALSWGIWHQKWRRYDQGARAFEYGMRAAIQLFRQQDTQRNKLTRLQQMSQLPASCAFCNAKVGHLENAVLALEQGRALLLGEALDRNIAVVNRLISDGREDIAVSYRDAVAVYKFAVNSQRNR